MLTHSEAQALISASLDQPLDPDIEDVLAEHLATCAECRYFAASSQRLANALESWPTIPASPAVRQGVWEAIETPTPWWQRIGGLTSGQTAAVVSTAAIALLVIALATLAIVRLNGGNGDDEGARLAAGTSEAIALATQTPQPTDTPAPTVTPTSPPADTPSPTETPQPTTAPTEPAETPVDLTAETAPPTEAATEAPTEAPATEPATEAPAETPVDLTGTENAPSPTSDVQPAFAPVTEEANATATQAPPTETPVPPTATAEPTATPSPTPEPTATPSPTPEPAPADFTVTLLDEAGAPVPDACWALMQDGETVEESCDTAEAETTEFARNGRAGFFGIPSGTYTLRLTEGPEGVAVEDRTVEIAPGSNDIETITATTATPSPAPTSTPEPTSTPAPTSTPEPTATPSPTPEPTSTPEPEGASQDVALIGTPADSAPAEETSPPIEPVGGQTVEGTQTPEAMAPAATESGPGQDIISPAEATRAAGNEPVATEPQVIEPIDGATAPAQTAEAATGDGTGATVPAAGDGYDLTDAPVPYEPWDDTSLRLTFEDDAIVFSAAPDAVSLDGPTVQQETDGDATYLAVCDGSCEPATLASGEGSFTDSPIGWVNDQLVYQRQGASGDIELRALTWVGEPAEDLQIGSATTTLTPYGAGYVGDNGILVPCAEGWLLVGDGQASVIDANPYGDPALVRTRFSASLISYVSGGQLIIADQSAPGTPISTIPFSGVDYDLSPDTDRVAISTGQGLEIRSRGGDLLGASGSQVRTGSVLWLGDGIYVIDLTNGVFRLVDPGALT